MDSRDSLSSLFPGDISIRHYLVFDINVLIIKLRIEFLFENYDVQNASFSLKRDILQFFLNINLKAI